MVARAGRRFAIIQPGFEVMEEDQHMKRRHPVTHQNQITWTAAIRRSIASRSPIVNDPSTLGSHSGCGF
jgi:hypothetical protein